MAVDSQSDTLLVATVSKGIWMLNSSSDPVHFERIDYVTDLLPSRKHVRQDPFGGTYFFDETTVTRYTKTQGWTPVLSVSNLMPSHVLIYDIAASPDGTLYVGTNDGIFIWREGTVAGHLGRFEGIGTSPVVQWLFFDAKNRLWFATQGFVGYYTERDTATPVVTIMMLNQPTTQATVTAEIPIPTATVTFTVTPLPTVTPEKKKASSLFELLTNFFADLISRFRK
jgi:hypothetical protein